MTCPMIGPVPGVTLICNRRLGGVLVALLVGLASAAPAMAGAGLVDQYTEQVPTASGSSGGGGGPTYSAPLSGSVRTQLYNNGGSDAKTLEKIATSARYGTPRVTHPPDATLGSVSPSPLSAAVNAVTGGSDSRLIGLFVALVATAAVMLGAAAARRGRRTGP
jgi:hypothetical protein